VNALDAAFVAYAGISALRQQIRPEQRVHGVISGRDWTPNGSFPIKTFNLFIIVLLPTPSTSGVQRVKRSTGDTDTFFYFLFVWVHAMRCCSHPRLRQDVMVGPRGRMGCARASARARGELPRVRARRCSSSSKFRFRLKNQHNTYYAKIVYPHFFLFSSSSYYRSGASATGCRHQVTLGGERYLDLRQNPVLGE
jgi:hypothetical protein